jgi:hypothetical protein
MTLTDIIQKILSFSPTETTQSLRINLSVFQETVVGDLQVHERDWEFKINRTLRKEEINPYLMSLKEITNSIITSENFDPALVTIEHFEMAINDSQFIETHQIKILDK